MRVYEYGDLDKPVIMLFPGTCCYWKSNFGHVIGELEKYFHTLMYQRLMRHRRLKHILERILTEKYMQHTDVHLVVLLCHFL